MNESIFLGELQWEVVGNPLPDFNPLPIEMGIHLFKMNLDREIQFPNDYYAIENHPHGIAEVEMPKGFVDYCETLLNGDWSASYNGMDNHTIARFIDPTYEEVMG